MRGLFISMANTPKPAHRPPSALRPEIPQTDSIFNIAAEWGSGFPPQLVRTLYLCLDVCLSLKFNLWLSITISPILFCAPFRRLPRFLWPNWTSLNYLHISFILLIRVVRWWPRSTQRGVDWFLYKFQVCWASLVAGWPGLHLTRLLNIDLLIAIMNNGDNKGLRFILIRIIACGGWVGIVLQKLLSSQNSSRDPSN